MIYRPPFSDSEEEYEGFYFGEDVITERKRQGIVKQPVDYILNAAMDGNLGEMRDRIESISYDVNSITKQGLTLLHAACGHGQLDIIEYLLKNNANPNRQIDSVTPLMEACNNRRVDSTLVYKMVQKLLEYDVVVNVSDKYGMTPFLFVCKNGHYEAAKLLIDKVAIDACDNQGWTAIFHAVDNDHVNIVNLLIEKGIDLNKVDSKGYTPFQIAQFHGFYDIVDMLPEPEDNTGISNMYYSYSTLSDIIPRIFPKSNVPEYFQDITSILKDIEMERFVQYFAAAGSSLGDFLTMTDESLEKIGIIYSVHRQKIKIELLNFHLHHWSKKSIGKVQRVEKDTFYEILMISANHLQNLIIIASSLKYIQLNMDRGIMGYINKTDAKKMKVQLNKYKKSLKDLIKVTKYLHTFSPEKSPLYIDYDEIQSELKVKKVRRYINCSILIGVSVVLILKIKKVF